jgi:hypothetical protein
MSKRGDYICAIIFKTTKQLFMRKFTLVLALVAATVAVNAQSSVRNNAIKLNPLSLAALTGNVSYERAVSDNQSIQIGGFYSGLSISDLKYTGFGITPEYRIYFGGNKEVFNGVYVAPYARYQNFTFKEKVSEGEASFSSVGGGAIIGWQKMWSSGFTLDLFGFRTGLTLGFGF